MYVTYVWGTKTLLAMGDGEKLFEVAETMWLKTLYPYASTRFQRHQGFFFVKFIKKFGHVTFG